MGAYEMLKKKGLEKQIHVIGIGSEQIYIDAVRDGKLYGIVTQSPEFEASLHGAVRRERQRDLPYVTGIKHRPVS